MSALRPRGPSPHYPPAERRLGNQAFFAKIYVTETDTVTGVVHQGFEIVLDPGIQHIALDTTLTDQQALTQLDQRLADVAGSNIDTLVGVTGCEPATSSGVREVINKSQWMPSLAVDKV